MPLTRWLPPVVWMALILWFSTDVGSAVHTGAWLRPLLRALAPWATPAQIETIHGLIRKGGHVTEYAILAGLWLRALGPWRAVRPAGAALIAFAISLANKVAHSIPKDTHSRTSTMLRRSGPGAAKFPWRGHLLGACQGTTIEG